MILGFAGPRTGMKDPQKVWLRGHLLTMEPTEFHHGCCTGSDAKAHKLALEHTSALIVIHPPVKETFIAWECIDWGNERIKVLPRKGYHERDWDIVNACETLLATPDGEPKGHSGTWDTINFALSVSKPILVCYPDGHVDPWNIPSNVDSEGVEFGSNCLTPGVCRQQNLCLGTCKLF